jgi:hypothetical protein
MQAPYDTSLAADVFAEAKNTFNWLIGHLTDAQTGTLAYDRLEEIITEQGRELQRLLLQAHLDLRALRELEQVRHARHQDGGAVGVIGADGVPRRRVELGHHRLLATVTETVRGSFDAALAAITTRCGQVIGKRQIEQLVAQAAADVDAFYAARTVLPCTASTVLAISVDGKGIAMRPEALRPATVKAAARARATFRTRLAAGEKPARKRMATLGGGLRRRTRTPAAA